MAVAADVVRRPPPGVVVLIYHRVGGASSSEVDLPTPLFEDQMAMLSATGRVAPLGTALEALSGAVPATDPPPVAVTFDDGTDDFVVNALPVLVRHNIPVTLYAATELIDEHRPFPNGGTPVSWSGLGDACATGLVDVGSHTHRHRLLDRLPPDEVAEELDRSIDLIEAQLGRPVRDFAYPKALGGSPEAERAVRARFRSAALAGTRANQIGATDPHRLRRPPIQTSDATRWFERKIEGRMALEDDLRRLLNRRRYATATR